MDERKLAGAAEWRTVTALATSATSPFVDLDRAAWSALSKSTPLPLSAEEVHRLQGLGDRIDLTEVREVYLPLSRLLNLYVAGSEATHSATSTFLGEAPARTPFVIGVAGSVAVGKSTTARLLRELLARWPGTPRVELVTTDGFLYPNAILKERDIMSRKGFPESYDQKALRKFVADVKSGASEVRAPVYSHLTYDIVPGAEVVVRQPDVLIVEGLNVLQPARRHGLSVSDYFDFSLYVHAPKALVRQWYIARFHRLRATAFTNPDSYFHRYIDLTEMRATERAEQIWASINEPNLSRNIRPTRDRAKLVLFKGPDHTVERVRLRKI